MSASELPTRTVPLEAGRSAENPPCPACGEPLFGWATLPLSEVPVRRCETCGLGVAGDPPTRDEAVAELRATGGTTPNRGAMIARFGAAGWAGIEKGRRLMFTTGSVKRLGFKAKVRPSVAIAGQTLLNSFTFGHNIALAKLGRAEATPAAEPWQRRIDNWISVLASPVVLVAAVATELIATVAWHGASLAIGPDDEQANRPD